MKLEMSEGLKPLFKGKFITRREIAEFYGKRPEEADEFDALRLKSFLEENFDFTCKTEMKYSVRILTDKEASHHNHNQIELSIRKMFRRHRKQLQVDRTELAGEDVESHTRRIVVQAALLQGLRDNLANKYLDYGEDERICLPKINQADAADEEE